MERRLGRITTSRNGRPLQKAAWDMVYDIPLIVFSTVPSSLEILAYYDDVEVCNPLGYRAKKHKLGVPVCP